MSTLLVGVAAFITWLVLWAIAAGIFTALTVVAATVIERYLVVTDRWTYPLWIVALALTPAPAFGMNWTLWGLIAPERFYGIVCWASFAAGGALAVAGVVVVVLRRREEDRGSELATLAGVLIVDAISCALSISHFGPITGYMAGLGGS